MQKNSLKVIWGLWEDKIAARERAREEVMASLRDTTNIRTSKCANEGNMPLSKFSKQGNNNMPSDEERKVGTFNKLAQYLIPRKERCCFFGGKKNKGVYRGTFGDLKSIISNYRKSRLVYKNIGEMSMKDEIHQCFKRLNEKFGDLIEMIWLKIYIS